MRFTTQDMKVCVCVCVCVCVRARARARSGQVGFMSRIRNDVLFCQNYSNFRNKLHEVLGPWRRHVEEWRCSSTHFNLGTIFCEWSASRPGRVTPGERTPGSRWIGGWVGSRAGLDAVVKRTNSCHY